MRKTDSQGTVLKSLEVAFQEVKLMQDGTIPKTIWDEFKKRVQNDNLNKN